MIATAAVAVALGMTAPVPPPSTEELPIPEGYVVLVDATGTLAMAVPETWTDVDLEPAVAGDVVMPYLAASPDLATFLSSFDAPGVLYSAFPYTADPLELVRSHGLTSGCATAEVRTYDDPVFEGVVQIGTDCGPDQMVWNMVVASPADQAFTAVVQVQAPPDDEAMQIVLRTFNLAPDSATPGSATPDASTTVPPAPTTTVTPAPTTAAPSTTTSS